MSSPQDVPRSPSGRTPRWAREDPTGVAGGLGWRLHDVPLSIEHLVGPGPSCPGASRRRPVRSAGTRRRPPPMPLGTSLPDVPYVLPRRASPPPPPPAVPAVPVPAPRGRAGRVGAAVLAVAVAAVVLAVRTQGL